MKRLHVLLLVLGLGATALGTWWWFRPTPTQTDDGDPRLTFPTPYRNVRPEVRYVGDETCAACHEKEAASYRQHPMGRSLAPVATLAEVEKYGPEAGSPFTRDGLRYEVVRRGGRMTHRVRRWDGGDSGPALEVDVHYAVGSGTRGRTYLVERDGCLFQSPISWYSGKGTWDLTPGMAADEQFERPARPACLFCHTNAVAPAPDSVNRYHAPLFRGHAIGCERCHGPGELHVAARSRGEAVEGADYTIVNPARLAPALRDSVCAQCHLQGEVRVLRRGRDLFDFRPGLPLGLFVSTFVRHPELADGPTVGGHVEQVQDSRCFQGSGGRLGCTSCHDPHAVPAPGAKAAHYRAACLKCHTESRCTESPERRQQKADRCIDCHMPRAESRIAHTAIADHRVPRRPAPPRPPRQLSPGEAPLLLFGAEGGAARDDEEKRDLGLALADLGRNHPGLGRIVAPMSLPLLEAAVGRRPDDVPAREARGFLLWQLGRQREGLEEVKAALDRAPRRETALTYAAVLSARLGQTEDAIGYWRRAIAISPAAAPYRYRLGKVLAERGEWARALEESAAALRLNPFHGEAQELHAQCQAKTKGR